MEFRRSTCGAYCRHGKHTPRCESDWAELVREREELAKPAWQRRDLARDETGRIVH